MMILLTITKNNLWHDSYDFYKCISDNVIPIITFINRFPYIYIYIYISDNDNNVIKSPDKNKI